MPLIKKLVFELVVRLRFTQKKTQMDLSNFTLRVSKNFN